MKKLAIVSTHPIQYNAPWFALLNEQGILNVMVFYTWEQSKEGKKFDTGFQMEITWDIPLLTGYNYCFVKNTSNQPGSHHFKGINNPTLNAEIENWGADAILIFGWAFQSHLKCLKYFYGKITVLFRGDSTLLDEDTVIKSFIKKQFLTWVYKHINYALYVGTNNKNYFLKNGVPENKLIYVPHAIDNERFQHNESDFEIEALKIRKELGFKNEDVVMLFAGKIEKKKNPLFLLNLLNKFPNKSLKLVYVGTGELQNELTKITEGDKRVVFMGFQNQQVMPIIYRIADVYILPSNGPGETWGLALNEAMACGRAVVATDKVGGAVDLITPNLNGLIIKNNDTSDLEELISNALTDKSKLNLMGVESKKKIQAFCFEKIVMEINKLIT